MKAKMTNTTNNKVYMKHLKNCIKLGCQVKVYVPSTIDVDIKIDSNEWIDKTLHFLSSQFGGATSTNALGAWMTEQGKLVKEHVNVVFAYCHQEQLENCIDNVYDFCLSMKQDLRQESIALEVNGEMYLI